MPLLLLAFWPVGRWYLARIGDGSDEPMGLLALAVAACFLFRERRDLRLTQTGAWFAAACLALYVAGASVLPALVKALLALATLAALSGTLRRHPAIWGLFALSLPLLASMQFFLGIPLRAFAASLATGALHLGGLAVERRGTELLWNGLTIGVDPSCSGIQMLWTTLLAVLALSAWKRLGWTGTAAALLTGTAIVLCGNALRVYLLFFLESGIWHLPAAAHEGIGLAVFTLVILASVSAIERWPLPTGSSREPEPVPRHPGIPANATLITLALFAALLPALPVSNPASPVPPHPDFTGWPALWDGRGLEPLPLSPTEARFARDFPGKIASFTSGPDTVILRWVTRPTRMLHSSADCLRASGYVVEIERAGRFLARRDGVTYLVEERITGPDGTWNEVPAWFWSAALGRTRGPWWAATTIRPLSATAHPAPFSAFVPPIPAP